MTFIVYEVKNRCGYEIVSGSKANLRLNSEKLQIVIFQLQIIKYWWTSFFGVSNTRQQASRLAKGVEKYIYETQFIHRLKPRK